MDAIRVGSVNNGIKFNTFRFSSVPAAVKADKLKEILDITRKNTKVIYVFKGSRELNDITLYIRKEIEKVRGGRSRDMSFANMYMLVFFYGFLLTIGQHKDSAFWTKFLGRTREARCCVCLRDDLHFFEKCTCLEAWSAVVCETCVETFQCPLCRHPTSFSCWKWDPDIGGTDDQPRHIFRLTP